LRAIERRPAPVAEAAPDDDHWRAGPSFAIERESDPETERLEARRRAEAERAAREADERRRAEVAEAESRAQAERRAEAARREQADEARQRMEKEMAAEARRQFDALQARIASLQQSFDANQIEPVRGELLELLRRVEEIGRDGRSVAAAVGEVSTKLDDMEAKLNAARNMAGTRLGELTDRLSGLTERLIGMEAEVPGFDALRENQTAILERFDRMEGLVHRLASPEDLLERVDGIRRHLQNIASQREVARIEEQILQLADRVDALPEDLSDRDMLERIEGQLQVLASELADARRQRTSGAAEIGQRLADLSATVREMGDVDYTPDLSPLDHRLAEIAGRLEEDRRRSSDALERLERRLAGLTEAVEKEEDDAAAEILAGLTRRMDALAEAIEAQDARGARRDLHGLDRKLDQLARSLQDQSERLAAPQLQPLEERLERMQAQIEAIARRAEAPAVQMGPFVEKLQEISERISGLGASGDPNALSQRLAAIEERLAGLNGRGPDTRALHTQLESVVSRLELLKGRSIDPARMNELFDRVDAAMRSGFPDERLERLERKLEGVAVPAERFDRLEKRIAETSRAGIPDDRFDRIEKSLASAAAGASAERLARLEEKLDQIGRAYSGAAPAGEGMTQDDVADLRDDIVALRRELRSLPGLGEGEQNLGGVLKTIAARLETLSDDPPATTAELEKQIERLAQMLEDSGGGRLAVGHIETSLRAIEERLDETRRAMLLRSARDGGAADSGEVEAVAGLARALSDDVTVLKGAADASEKKTKDALEALQGTLEAVVKRMAFLERDAEAAGSAGERREPPALTFEPGASVGPQARAEPQVAVAMHPPVKGEAPREPASGGLFSRFTSSQLLRRATGGRTDSFTPDSDEAEESPDLPLEPGTDSPLDSALAGAPSSDTALMSGGRAKGRAGASSSTEAPAGEAAIIPSEPISGDDFLAAARRAAQAAAAEVAEAEREEQEARQASGLSRMLNLVRSRRRVLLASVLAVAVAFAALQLVRGRIAADEPRAAAASKSPAVERSVEPEAPPAKVSATQPAPARPDAVAEPPPVEEVTTASLPPAPRPQEPATAPAQLEPTVASRPAEALATSAEISDEPVIAPRDEAAPAGPEPQGLARPTPAARADATGLSADVGPEGLRKAAMAGDPVAAFEVAARFAEGRGAPQDLEAAVAWYTRAADAGLAPAQYRLGSIYEKGMGVEKDAAAAQRWYAQAAEAGNVKAMHNLAVLYAEGAGGEPDLDRAAELFREAAEHGVRDSQFNLAILHARGLGVKQDMVEAYKWFAVAASSGDAEALKRRDIIGKSLSEPDLAKAQAAAAGFEPLPLIAEANDVMLPEGGWTEEDATSVEVPQSDNDLVALVQMLLAEKGYDPGPPDGLLGKKTIEAISIFQEKAGLPKTGHIDQDLVAALQQRPT
jgi:localization factor PodJL